MSHREKIEHRLNRYNDEVDAFRVKTAAMQPPQRPDLRAWIADIAVDVGIQFTLARNNEEAKAWLRRALEWCEKGVQELMENPDLDSMREGSEGGLRYGLSTALLKIGLMLGEEDRLISAASGVEESASRMEPSGDPTSIAIAKIVLGELDEARDRLKREREDQEESLKELLDPGERLYDLPEVSASDYEARIEALSAWQALTESKHDSFREHLRNLFEILLQLPEPWQGYDPWKEEGLIRKALEFSGLSYHMGRELGPADFPDLVGALLPRGWWE